MSRHGARPLDERGQEIVLAYLPAAYSAARIAYRKLLYPLPMDEMYSLASLCLIALAPRIEHHAAPDRKRFVVRNILSRLRHMVARTYLVLHRQNEKRPLEVSFQRFKDGSHADYADKYVHPVDVIVGKKLTKLLSRLSQEEQEAIHAVVQKGSVGRSYNYWRMKPIAQQALGTLRALYVAEEELC